MGELFDSTKKPEFARGKIEDEKDEIMKSLVEIEKEIQEAKNRLKETQGELDEMRKNLIDDEDAGLTEYIGTLKKGIADIENILTKLNELKSAFEYLLKHFQDYDKESKEMLEDFNPDKKQ